MRTRQEIQEERIVTLVESLRSQGPGTVSAVRNRLWRTTKARVRADDFAEARRRGLVAMVDRGRYSAA